MNTNRENAGNARGKRRGRADATNGGQDVSRRGPGIDRDSTGAEAAISDLRAMMTPGQRALADFYAARLPKSRIVSKPDLCAAFWWSEHTAEAFIDNGSLVAVDIGRGTKKRWMIERDSALLLVHRRILGIRGDGRRP